MFPGALLIQCARQPLLPESRDGVLNRRHADKALPRAIEAQSRVVQPVYAKQRQCCALGLLILLAIYVAKSLQLGKHGLHRWA